MSRWLAIFVLPGGFAIAAVIGIAWWIRRSWYPQLTTIQQMRALIERKA